MAVPAQFPTTTKTPMIGVSVILGTGGSGGHAVKKVLMLGVGLAGGTKTAGDIDVIPDGTTADTYYGAGSSLARMCRCAMEEMKGAQVYGGFVADAGGAAAAATITFAAGPAGSDCVYECTINGWTVTCAIPSGTAAAAAGPLLNTAIQTHDFYDQMGITSVGPAAVVTITAVEANAETTTYVTNIWQDDSNLDTLTATLNTGAVVGAGALDLTAILAAAVSDRYDYIVARTSDSTNGGLLETHCDTLAGPTLGKRQQSIIGSMDTPGNQITLAQAINAHRVQVIGCELYQTAHYENIARWVAHRQHEEQIDAGVPYKDFPLGRVMAPHLTTDYMTDAECEAALNAGVTPLMVRNGEVQVPRSITSRSQTAGGAPDYTVLDTANVTVPDWCADDISSDFATRYLKKTGVAFKVMDDPADGSTIPQFTCTPSIVEDDLEGKLWAWYELGLIVHPKSPVDHIAQIAASYAAYRINAQAPVAVAPGLMIMDVALYQRTG